MHEILPQEYNNSVDGHFSHIAVLLEIKGEISSMRHETNFEVKAIRSELTEFKKDINKAFTKDYDGSPDYIEHRKKHEKLDKEDLKLDEYKTNFVKHFINWAGIGLIGLVLSALLYYVKAGNI